MAATAQFSSHLAGLSAENARIQRRLILVLWLLGLPGVMASVWFELPSWLRTLQIQWAPDIMFFWAFVPLSLALLIPVWIGVRMGPYVGLSTPVLIAWACGRSPRRAVRYLALPGVAGGIVGAAWLVTLAMVWPERLSLVDPTYDMPLLAKVLYGGFTEELIMRFGGLTLVTWALWRTVGANRRRVGWGLGFLAIVLTAMLWVGLNMALKLWVGESMPQTALPQLLISELCYGVLAGVLFRCYGLEAAMLAHVIAYVLSHGLV